MSAKFIMLKKGIAEFIGTMFLVIGGCGTAMLVGCSTSDTGFLLTALAFGLSLIAMAYSIGVVSGCHINPAVSFAMLITKRMHFGEFIVYVISQILGAIAGSEILYLLFNGAGLIDQTGALGTNGISGVNGDAIIALIVEALLTFFFVLVILFVTAKSEYSGIAGLIIGLTLTIIHIIGITFTGTSVNPARSLGPAIIASLNGVSSTPLTNVWIFIAGPLVGALVAAGIYLVLKPKNS